MCTPSVMIATTIASAYMQARAAQQQGNFQNKTAIYNARVAENQAEAVKNQGVEAENIQRRKTAELLSKQRAQLGASNVEIDSGSALQLQQDTQTLGEADALRIRSNTASAAEALQTGADLTRAQGGYAKTAGNNAAIGSILGGASQIAASGVADKWYEPDSAANQSGGVTFPSGVTAYPLSD